MPRHILLSPLHVALTSLLVLAACASQCLPQARNQSKIFGGYFEEWGIGYAHYNIADLQKNGVADELTHLIYAFGNVTIQQPRYAQSPIRQPPIRIQRCPASAARLIPPRSMGTLERSNSSRRFIRI